MSRHVTVSPAGDTLLITDFGELPNSPFQIYGEAAMFAGCCLGYEGIPDEEWIKPAETATHQHPQACNRCAVRGRDHCTSSPPP